MSKNRQASWMNSPLQESQFPHIIDEHLLSESQKQLLHDVIDPERFSRKMPPLNKGENKRLLKCYHWIDCFLFIPYTIWRRIYKDFFGWNKNQRAMVNGYLTNGVAYYNDLAYVFEKLDVHIVYYPAAGEDRIPRIALGSDGHERMIHTYRTDGGYGVKVEPVDDIIDIEIAADIGESPLKDFSVDAIFWRAAFVAPKDYNRVLKNGGYFIIDEEQSMSTNVRVAFYRMGYKKIMDYHGIIVLKKDSNGTKNSTLKCRFLSIGWKENASGIYL